MKTNDKTVHELRAEGWGVVLISPKEFEEQTGKTLSRAEIELIEDCLGDDAAKVIYCFHWAPSWRENA